MHTLIHITALTLIAVAQASPATTQASDGGFPRSWIGTWRGPCTYTPAGAPTPAREFTMELRIAPTKVPTRYAWTIMYIDGETRQERPYELVIVNPARGMYQIDEKNSIVIDARFVDGALYSAFTVSDALITASYRMHSGKLIAELVTLAAHGPTTTGGEGVPDVGIHAIRGVQRAVLSRD